MSHLFAQADSARLPLADASVDLVVGSPPYADARLYLEDGRDLGIARDQFEWVEWMLAVTEEALRVTRGAVIWVCAGVTRARNYWPCCEGLSWEAHKRGWLSESPCFWHRYGIPGSGGDQWFRKDVEFCLAFKRTAVLPWSDNTACGEPPKFGPGGAMSHRLSDGARVNQWGARPTSGRTRRADGSKQAAGRPSHVVVAKHMMQPDGSRETQGYVPPVVANPGTLIQTGATGGNCLGHALAHENEAPYPEDVPERFIKSLCPTGGRVLDPFSGSGTTVSVAARLGRVGIGFDLRRSQCELGRRRLERPHAPVVKKSAATTPMPLFGD
ncbi:DNA-methyltransferase [Paludisphaera soli]|uniref:DNA-methyltransferase n=1 Tax=Paludisphaera soli TaxID=2712865 RepID=UPI0013EDC728|nr:DNA methyltransferase [Paludisphaera soli]